MGNTRNPKKVEKPCSVRWVHRPDAAAEEEFWRLYLKLALEIMVEAKQDGREDQNDRKK